MNVYTTALLWVLGAAALAVLVNILVHRFSPTDQREDQGDAAGKVFALVGGLTAVLIAFVLIAALDAVKFARETTAREGNSVVGVSWAGSALPEPARTQIRDLCRAYVSTVARQEWPRMESGEPVGAEGVHQLDELRLAIVNAPAEGEWQESRKAEASDKLFQVFEARQERLDMSGKGLNPVVWFALVVGGVLTMIFPFLFGPAKLIPHTIIVVALAVTVVMLLFAVAQLENPFSGPVRVEPDTILSTIDRMI